MAARLPHGVNSFLQRHARRLKAGKTLVVGSKVYGRRPDRRELYDHAVGVDLFDGDGVDFTHDLEKPLPEHYGKFDHIDCCSVLEHVARPWLMCANIEAAMVKGASILIQAPFVWRIHEYPGDFWRISAEALPILFPSIRWIETGYLVGDHLKKLIPSLNLNGKRYLQRAEVMGFGIKCDLNS